MLRSIHIGLFPQFPETIQNGVMLVTLNSSEAAKRSFSSITLNALARETLQINGLTIASAAVARNTLKRVILNEYPDADAAGLAKRIANVLLIVLRTGIEAERLVKYGSPRVKQLGRIAIAYRKSLRGNGLIDKAELLWAAAGCDLKRRPIVIFGYHRARKEEIHFIDAIAGDGSTYFLPCGSDGIFTVNRKWAEFLEGRGWTPVAGDSTAKSAGERSAARFIHAGTSSADADALAYANIEDEVRGALTAAKQLIVDGSDPYEIAIAARDQNLYAPVVAAVADEYGLPVRIDHNVPLGSTAFGGFVRILIEAVGKDLPFESTMRLVMHPFGPKLAPRLLAEARKLHTSGHVHWSELCPELANVAWAESQPLSSWAENLRAALTAFRVRANTAQRAGELIAFNTFLEALTGAVLHESGPHIKFETFAAVVSEILSDESAKFRPARAGVALVEPKNIAGSSFDHLFILGMAEGIFPRPASEDPVVDFYERKQLAAHGANFAEAAEVARWEELSLYFTLLAARKQVVLSYSKMIDNRESVASSFFQRLGIQSVPAAAESASASSIEERRRSLLRHNIAVDDIVIQDARKQFAVESRRESSLPFDEYDGVIGVPFDPASRTWSASQLTTIGQCAFRWYAQRLLRLAPPDEMQTGLDPSTRGKLFHKALEIAVTVAKDALDIRAATLEQLDAAFAKAELDDDVNLPQLPNWEIERQEQIRDLRKAVTAADFIFDGSRVVGIEQKFEGVWQRFPLTGYIDRVDDTLNGLIAIDYKTSGSVPKGAKDRSGKLSVDVQIPLYANFALKKLYPEGTLGDSAYYSLTKGEILRTVKPDDMEKLDMLADDIHQILAEGSFAVDPDDAEYACTYCEFETVCRKGPRLRRKSRT